MKSSLGARAANITEIEALGGGMPIIATYKVVQTRQA